MDSYPIWLALFVILPLALLWAFARHTLMKYARMLGFTVLGCLAVSVPWDILSVNDHIWYFQQPHVLGIWLLGLPLEEYVYIAGVGLLACSVVILLWERYGKAE
jgi:lycopene cyclase domain-containing protein